MLCCAVLCSAVHYFALCDLLCTVQYTVLCYKVVVDVVEVVVAVMPTVRYLRSPIPSHLMSYPLPLLLPSSSVYAVQGEYIIHVGELAMSGTVGGVPQAPYGRYCRAEQCSLD